MRKFSKEELEKIQNAPVLDAQTGKLSCPKCGSDLIGTALECRCSNENCDFRNSLSEEIDKREASDH